MSERYSKPYNVTCVVCAQTCDCECDVFVVRAYTEASSSAASLRIVCFPQDDISTYLSARDREQKSCKPMLTKLSRLLTESVISQRCLARVLDSMVLYALVSTEYAVLCGKYTCQRCQAQRTKFYEPRHNHLADRHQPCSTAFYGRKILLYSKKQTSPTSLVKLKGI